MALNSRNKRSLAGINNGAVTDSKLALRAPRFEKTPIFRTLAQKLYNALLKVPLSARIKDDLKKLLASAKN